MCTRRILGLAVVALLTLGDRARAYTNQWAAHIEGGEEVARQVAEDYGFRYLGKVSAASGNESRFLSLFLPFLRNFRDRARARAYLRVVDCAERSLLNVWTFYYARVGISIPR